MALASTTRSPVVPLTLKSGSKTPHGAPRRDIAAVPTAWNTLHPTDNVSFERGIIHRIDIRRRMVPDILSDLLIRVCGSQGFPRRANEPFPGPSGGESLRKFDGGNHRFDVEVGRQEVGIDDGRIKWICAPEFDLSTCPKGNEGSKDLGNRMKHPREVGEMRLVRIVIQLPSGSGNPGDAHPFDQINW